MQKVPTWATWGRPTHIWERHARQSNTTSSHLKFCVRSGIGGAKATIFEQMESPHAETVRKALAEWMG